MSNVITSTVFASSIMLGLVSAGLSGHTNQSPKLSWSGVADGSAQTAYTARFEQAYPWQDLSIAAVGAVKYAVFGQATKGAVVGKNGWIFTSEELEVSDGFDARIRASAEKVARAVETLTNRGIAVLPIIVPDKAEIYEQHLGYERPEAVVRRKEDFLNLLTAADVPFLDATEPLEMAMDYGDMFQKDDTHWSPLGSSQVAQAVASRLSDIPVKHSSVATYRGARKNHDGDLLAFVPTGPFRDIVGPERVRIDTFTTEVESQNSLFDTPQIDIVLVGTSFSARAEFHFEGFLKQAFQADVLNFAEEGLGPFAPMDALLASDFLTSTPPGIVLWEIPVRYVSKEDHQ